MRRIRLILLAGILTILSFIFIERSSSRRQLKALYESGLRPPVSKDNIFDPAAHLSFYDSLLRSPQNTPRQIMTAEYWKADAYLKLGDEKKAIALLQDVVEKLKANPGQSPVSDPRKYLALAWMRLGERNNCIAGHSMSSCIFPIRADGVYSDLYATQSAIALYEEILKERPNDLESRWLLNVAYMALGGYPTRVPAAWLIPGLDKENSSDSVLAFKDIAGLLRLNDHRNMAGGVIVDDFDNDGYLDIVTSDWGFGSGNGMHYYRNNANGSFTDLSVSSGLSAIRGGINIMQVDYNNDGRMDIFFLRGGWMGAYGKLAKTLLRNNGDGSFTDVTVESGLVSLHPTQTAVWNDFNNDGWPDVFIGHETSSLLDPHPCELWINNQDGTFTEVAAKAGCAVTGFVKGVTAADYDNDDLPDLFLSQRTGGKILLHNKGVHDKIPRFENVTHAAGLDKDTTFTFPAWFWDYDNDGWPDIFTCGYKFNGSLAKEQSEEALHLPSPSASTMYLYRNNHDGTFTNVSKEAGLDHPVFAMGSNFGDLDNDGWPDMYLGTGNPDFESLTPNRLFKNIGGKRFADVTGPARVGNLQKGHGVAFADLDNDGDQDIFIETGGAYQGDAYYNSFYLNPGQNDNNWISIALEGVRSNRCALGARLALTFTENGARRTVYADINSGGSFGASPLRKEIGIGKASMIDELRIKWPATGLVQVFKNIAPRQFIKIREGEKVFTKMQLRPLPFNRPGGRMNEVNCPPPAH